MKMSLSQRRYMNAALASSNQNEVCRQLSQLTCELQNGQYNIKQVNYCFVRLLEIFEIQHPDFDENSFEDWRNLPNHFSSLDQLIAFFDQRALRETPRDEKPESGASSSAVIQDLLPFIEENFSAEINLSMLSKRCNYSPNYLCKLFRQSTGMTIKDYILRRRMSHATWLLRNTQLNIGEIAEKCGFNDYFYFARVFKRTQGLTPSEYRNRNGWV